MGSQKHVVLDVTHQMIQKYVMHGKDGFCIVIQIQSLEYETEKTVLFWDILCHKNFVGMNFETNLASEYAPNPP